jgi:hypothetical protein
VINGLPGRGTLLSPCFKNPTFRGFTWAYRFTIYKNIKSVFQEGINEEGEGERTVLLH